MLNYKEKQKIIAGDGTTDDFLGHSTAIDGNTLVVGAYGDNIGAGSAYIFEKYNNKWIQVQKITASDGESLDYFGYENIAIYGNTIVVGAYQNDGNATKSGSAYIFEKNYDQTSDKQ